MALSGGTKDKGVGLRTRGGGFRKPLMEKYSPYSVLCTKSKPESAWPRSARSGPALSTARSHSSGQQMHGRWRDDVAWGSSYFLFLLVKFKQQHDCIISSAYMTRTRLGPLRCPETHIVFVVLLFFFLLFLSKRTKTNMFWRCLIETKIRRKTKLKQVLSSIGTWPRHHRHSNTQH